MGPGGLLTGKKGGKEVSPQFLFGILMFKIDGDVAF
jgi:hypothetical protein